MDEDTSRNYYMSRRDKLLKHFDRLMVSVKKVLPANPGKKDTCLLISAMRKEFETLIPQIPYIGGDKNRLTYSLVGAIEFLAVYRVLKMNGDSAKTVGKIILDASKMDLYSLSIWQKLKLRLSWRRMFSKQVRKYMKLGAKQSQKRTYPQDFVYKYIDGIDNEFDFGLDFYECAVCKFFHQQNADEFTPYVCMFDFVLSEFTNSGLQRTTTLAEGGKFCDFRYKKGRKISKKA